MLTPPDGLSDDTLVRVLGEGWGVAVALIDYRAVGFGSHHWSVVDSEGIRWFVTVDDVECNRRSVTEPDAAVFGRLRAALVTATALHDSGATFVVAPILTAAGEPVIRADRRFGVALYPHVDGQSYSWGDFASPSHRRAVLDLVVKLHTAHTTASRHAMSEDFTTPCPDELAPISEQDRAHWDRGPYARLSSALLMQNADKIRRLLLRHDELVHECRHEPRPVVLTHGEPHAGNTMLTAAGWVLIDWDTVLLAPPERDLWSLDPGDGSIIRAYADATGTKPRPAMLELYRLRWDLADIAAYVRRFRSPHSGSLDDDKSWDELCSLIGRLPGSLDA